MTIESASASLVAIMDSGTDISHRELAPKVWVNANEKWGSTVDLDKDGLPGDVYGWDFTKNSPNVFDSTYNNLITDDVKKFFDYYSKFETGQLSASSPETSWLKEHYKDQDLMNKVNFIGAYIHGTHVAGISLKNNDKAKVLSMKIIPTVYQDLRKKNPTNVSNNQNAVEIPTKTYDQFKADIVEEAQGQIDQMTAMHSILNFHKVDVVNQSFGIGWNDAQNFIHAAFVNNLKREPTAAEMKDILIAYFAKLMADGPKMYAAAPNTLFAIAAGNDNSNNDLNSDYPADVQAENKIVVAATLGYKKLADFSNYGATRVDVAAPGVAIISTAPVNNYIPLSGTSQATPYVTNIIAAIKDINPNLSVRDVKAIVLGTVDYKAWLKGKVKTAGIVNRSRALKAAEFSKTMSIDRAISSAVVTIMDVQTLKAFNLNTFELGLKLKPYRPSLLIQE